MERTRLKKPASMRANRSSEKWGSITSMGFQIVPDVLIRHQGYLKLTPLEMCVLLNILLFWWKRETKPRVSSAKTGERIGVDRREVRDAIQGLIDKKIIRRIQDAEGRPAFDIEPLVQKLSLLTELEQVK